MVVGGGLEVESVCARGGGGGGFGGGGGGGGGGDGGGGSGGRRGWELGVGMVTVSSGM